MSVPGSVSGSASGSASGSGSGSVRAIIPPTKPGPPTFDAFLFPAIGAPRMFQLTTVPEAVVDQTNGRPRLINRPHPSLYVSISHNENWQSKHWQSLFGMTADLPNPFVVFYPERQQSGEPLPINQAIKEIQGEKQYRPTQAWKGDIIVAKYRSLASGEIIDMAASDYVYIKNWFTFAYPEHAQL